MAIKAKIISWSAPNFGGLLRSTLIPLAFFNGAIWTLDFECGECGIESSIQQDEDKKYCKCPVCGTINKLK